MGRERGIDVFMMTEVDDNKCMIEKQDYRKCYDMLFKRVERGDAGVG